MMPKILSLLNAFEKSHLRIPVGNFVKVRHYNREYCSLYSSFKQCNNKNRRIECKTRARQQTAKAEGRKDHLM